MSMQERIIAALHQHFSPEHLDVFNESHQHNVPVNSETHFKVVVVSEGFGGQRLLQRHRAINTLLASEFEAGLHALAMHTYTPEEWQRKQQAPLSPKCMGGSKSD
ncbi:BolA/IbaG family iron-sulfur metabolism protein [Neiella marina]|uniref:BolA/IbaG family iron-sulfur metabolism protein n=1 Tax=Neiella holothuriorum TaxID=2870530 RepID=A0ABS7EHG7_9GAMM|nr:BolA/IbaG family iron-sulfur metabolism protein [Neiella holothuriorum]MBW8191788.1 BolA/IbaG family iron-sulfur metabolism protein [Neiella holothuriorum]